MMSICVTKHDGQVTHFTRVLASYLQTRSCMLVRSHGGPVDLDSAWADQSDLSLRTGRRAVCSPKIVVLAEGLMHT